MTARRFVVAPLGSRGDVAPLVDIAHALAERGGDCVVLANEHFRPTAEGRGLRFVATESAEAFEHATRNPRAWDRHRGDREVVRCVVGAMPGYFRAIESELQRGRFALIGSTWALACRVAREKFRVPTATVHVSPSGIRSALAPPLRRHDMEWTRCLPAWVLRAIHALEDGRDRRVAGRRIEEFARRNDARVVVRSLRGEYLHSPDLVLGLWPEWFAPPQRDWPAKAMLCGFPIRFGNAGALDPEIEAWLDEGDAPVLVAPASANPFARDFVAAAVSACERAGRRSLVATGYREQLPNPLPAMCRHAEWVPYAAVLPRCAAIVHQGGIGTASLAFAWGTPQLAIPQSHDQFDHARRIERLGVGRRLAAETIDAEAASATLAEILASETIRARAAEIAVRAREGCDWDRVCGALERLADQR